MAILIAFLALFLVVLGALAFATYKLFSVRDANGNASAPGVVLGCGAAIVLCGIGLLALATFVGGVFAISAAKSVEHVVKSVPEMNVRAWRDPGQHVHRSADHPLHVVLEWKGHSEPTESLLAKLQKIEPDADILVNVDYSKADDGHGGSVDVTTVDLAFPADDEDVDEIEEALHEMLPDVSLSEGLEIQLKSVRNENEEVR